MLRWRGKCALQTVLCSNQTNGTDLPDGVELSGTAQYLTDPKFAESLPWFAESLPWFAIALLHVAAAPIIFTAVILVRISRPRRGFKRCTPEDVARGQQFGELLTHVKGKRRMSLAGVRGLIREQLQATRLVNNAVTNGVKPQ
jgi:hypothetical protein